MPLDETVEIMRTFDEIRRQTGVPADRPRACSGVGGQLRQQPQDDPRRQGSLGQPQLGEVVEHPLVVPRRREGGPDEPAAPALAPPRPGDDPA